MVLAYNELVELVDSGGVENVPRENINGASIDVTLASPVLVESGSGGGVYLARKEAPGMVVVNAGDVGLAPGAFCLASTEQVFHLPDDVAAQFVLKSSLARSGLNHLMAGWCDPTWHGSALTMELQNVLQHHTLVLEVGMKIGQMVFFRTSSPVPSHASYAARGQYNNDRGVSASKGLR